MRLVRMLRKRASGTSRSIPIERALPPIPARIAERLIRQNDEEPLFPKLQRHGKGRPGVAQEEEIWWVIRDNRGRVVGGAMVAPIAPGHPLAIDVAVDPLRQGEGYATRLYEELSRAGIDVEAASAASLAHRGMTADGYAFMRARRLRSDPEAEEKIVAAANECPSCGPMT